MMFVIIGTASIIARHSSFYRRELAAAGNRELALDGLRGLAALMVVIHHAALSGVWLATSHWGDARQYLWQWFGPTGVMIFFMITGYLFWNRARIMKGKINPWKLWRGRLYRIAPLYLFSVGIILLLALVQVGTGWLTPENWNPLLRLFALGAMNWQTIGAMDFGDYNARVVWTLHYEWIFYLLLPFIAWLAVGRRILGVAVLFYALFFVSLGFNFNLPYYYSFFILGMLCPMFFEDEKLRTQLVCPRAAGLAMILTLLLLMISSPSHQAGASEGAFFPVFFVAAAGNNFFGLLIHPAIRCLGAISFSLYLLHGIAFHLVFHFLKTSGWSGLSSFGIWPVLILTAIMTTIFCAATYRWIEFPFISRGHIAPAKIS